MSPIQWVAAHRSPNGLRVHQFRIRGDATDDAVHTIIGTKAHAPTHDGSEWGCLVRQIFAQLRSKGLEHVHCSFSKQCVNAHLPPMAVDNERQKADATTCTPDIARMISHCLHNVQDIVAVLHRSGAPRYVRLVSTWPARQKLFPTRHQ
jgi:hypothetical protein